MKAPQRLLEDPAVAPALRSDLERTAATGIAYDAGKGLAALQAAVAAQGATGSSVAAAGESGAPAAGHGPIAGGAAATTKSAALLGPAGAKLALVATGAAVIIAGVLAWPNATPQTTAPAQKAPEATDSRQETPAAARPDAIDLDLAHARALSGGERDADAALRREIAELGRIKALLAADPAQAYRLAQAGHRTHPAGMLRHEREGLAILALWNLDRRSEAAARTRAFLQRYPASPLRAELARRLERAGGGAEEPR